MTTREVINLEYDKNCPSFNNLPLSEKYCLKHAVKNNYTQFVLSYASVRHYESVCVSGAVSDTGEERGMRAASSLSIVNRHGERTYTA